MLSYYLSMVETQEDKEKVEYIFDNFRSYMANAAAPILRNNEQDINDVVQNTMLVIIENIKIIDISDYVKARNLCIIIAKNKAKDYCKLKENQAISYDDLIWNDFLDNSAAPEELAIGNDTYEFLLKTIYNLEEKYRDICILKFVHEYKEREIANVLGLSDGTVSVRISRGRKLLQEKLRKVKLHV